MECLPGFEGYGEAETLTTEEQEDREIADLEDWMEEDELAAFDREHDYGVHDESEEENLSEEAYARSAPGV